VENQWINEWHVQQDSIPAGVLSYSVSEDLGRPFAVGLENIEIVVVSLIRELTNH
jgi:hypothetical protein